MNWWFLIIHKFLADKKEDYLLNKFPKVLLMDCTFNDCGLFLKPLGKVRYLTCQHIILLLNHSFMNTWYIVLAIILEKVLFFDIFLIVSILIFTLIYSYILCTSYGIQNSMTIVLLLLFHIKRQFGARSYRHAGS